MRITPIFGWGTLRSHPDLGYGILLFRKGFGVVSRNARKKNFTWAKDLTDKSIDVEDVLVDNDYLLLI